MWSLDMADGFTRRFIIWGLVAGGVLMSSPAFLEAYIMYKRKMDEQVREMKRHIASEKLKDNLSSDDKLQ